VHALVSEVRTGSALIAVRPAALDTLAMSYDHLLWPTGTAYFFSAHLRDRSSSLLVEQAQTLRLAFRVAQQARPFRINAARPSAWGVDATRGRRGGSSPLGAGPGDLRPAVADG